MCACPASGRKGLDSVSQDAIICGLAGSHFGAPAGPLFNIFRQSTFHEVKWQRRMLKAAEDAEKLGRVKLAGMLRKEIEAYKERGPYETANEVYRQLAEWTRQTAKQQDVTYDSLIRALAMDCGRTVRELKQKYRKLRQIYTKTMREHKEDEEAKARMLQSIAQNRPG